MLSAACSRRGRPAASTPPDRAGRLIVLTSGTTAAPKGARRRTPTSLAPLASVLDRIPLNVGDDGEIEEIFVRNGMLFEGYTFTSPTQVSGLLGTGDLGHFNADGLLFVDGRADDMIISGGENVFPRPVEELIATLPQVREMAVIGVPDDEFGQRLAAYVASTRVSSWRRRRCANSSATTWPDSASPEK